MAANRSASGSFKAIPNASASMTGIKAAQKVRGNRAEDRSELFDDKFLKTLEHLHMVSRKVFAGNIRAERRTRKVTSPSSCSSVTGAAGSLVNSRWLGVGGELDRAKVPPH